MPTTPSQGPTPAPTDQATVTAFLSDPAWNSHRPAPATTAEPAEAHADDWAPITDADVPPDECDDGSAYDDYDDDGSVLDVAPLPDADSTTTDEDPRVAEARRHRALAADPLMGHSLTSSLRAVDDVALADSFVLAHSDNVRVVAGAWAVWLPVERNADGDAVAGGHWEMRAETAGFDAVLAHVRTYRVALHRRIDALSDALDADPGNKALRSRRGQLIAAASRLGTERTAHAVEKLARKDPRLVMAATEFDADPYLLTVANGTIDLRTGKLRPHAQEDRITHRLSVSYDTDAACPTWTETLDGVFLGDQELGDWFRRAVGYTITGATTEQVLFFLYGSGSNGKSTVVNAIRHVIGPLYQKVKAPALMASASAGEGATPEVAKLRGTRFAVTSELPDARFDEATIKDLVGEDDIAARYLNSNPFTFTPTHKLWLFGNHRPAISGTDDGIWRRIKMVPFLASFRGASANQDLKLRLEAEATGILAWAVRGCLEWQAQGLGACAAVDGATSDYRTETDTIGAFLAECCVDDVTAEVKASTLYGIYSQWAKVSGHGAQSSTKFGRTLTDRGYGKRTSNGIVRLGLRLNPEALDFAAEAF